MLARVEGGGCVFFVCTFFMWCVCKYHVLYSIEFSSLQERDVTVSVINITKTNEL